MNCCVDVDMEKFRVEKIIPQKEDANPLIKELKEQQNGLWKMYFDGIINGVIFGELCTF